jgi:hypothetical protein
MRERNFRTQSFDADPFIARVRAPKGLQPLNGFIWSRACHI